MKIKIFVILFLIFNSICFSQIFSGFGFKGGLVSAFLSRTEISTHYPTNSRLGFAAGLFGEFFNYKKISTVTEINYEQKGGNLQYADGENRYLLLNVISIPMLAKLSIPLKNFQPYFSAGPRIDIYLNHSAKNKGDGYFGSINPVNFGMTIAAGIEIRVAKKIFLLAEGSYSPDFTIYYPYNQVTVHDITLRNTSFEFRTGIKFNH